MDNVPNILGIRKEKPEKHWSYPVQTCDLVEGLQLDKINLKCKPIITFSAEVIGYPSCRHTYVNHPIQVYYRNHKPTSDWFDILSVGYKGKQNKGYNGPVVYIQVGLVPAKYREEARAMFKEYLFPFMRKWLNEIFNNEMKSYGDWNIIAQHRTESCWRTDNQALRGYVALDEKSPTGSEKELVRANVDLRARRV